MATIDTNMSLVMIDPNEPLELYDGTIIKGRLEWFLYALCCLDYGNLPTPLSRIEEWANALITNELPNMEPQSRAEEFFKAILTGDTSNLPTPQSRSEVLLDKLARGENDFTNVEKIQSRYEFLLAYLIKNGGGIGNIDYVLYKFQKEDETLYNTKERPVKSAFLSGQTLVNFLKNKYNHCNLPTSQDVVVDGANTPFDTPEYRIKQVDFTIPLTVGKEYLVAINVKSMENVDYLGVYIYDGTSTTYPAELRPAKIGLNVVKYTPTSPIKQIAYYVDATNGKRATFGQPMIIEYQEGMENWDIPYFEGMQSVKMPVLTTTGKNLFNPEWLNNKIKNCETVNGLQFTLNSDYTIKVKGTLTSSTTIFHPQNVIENLEDGMTYTSRGMNCQITNYDGTKLWQSTFTVNKATQKRIEFYHQWNTLGEVIDKIYSPQIEYGTVATSYEPYKSNILTVNEDVTLRGIGDVKDELDCLTGEKTERIGEIILDGSEGVWSNHTGLSTDDYDVYWSSNGFVPSAGKKILSDKLKYSNPTTPNTFRINDSGGLFIGVSKGVNIRDYLSQNTPKIQYDLTEPTVKTVDLTITDQGGATIPKLKTFDKITHVNVSATDILPGEVEMEVATTIGEDLSGTLYSTMEDIETKQEALKESNNAQTESVNSTMMATTEIYESLL